ncbi:MAG: hypothetical protein WCC06_00735 [Candidatus Aminicenantales bacterium]
MTERPDSDETNMREEALSLYSGPRRTDEIFCLVAEGPKSIQQLLKAVPGDKDFIREIVQIMVEDNLIKSSGGADVYELSSHGRKVKKSLDQLPEDVKAQAYKEAWGTPPPDGY